jgi:threonine synthase
VVYYFKAYFAATHDDRQAVSFAVPSGNFGNIYAGYVAARMGLPVRRLVLAANENDVLDEFFRTGKYRVRRQVQHTTSPSMDISKASNFERYVFDLVGRDAAAVRDLYRRLDADGEFDLAHSHYWPRVAQSGFVSGKSSHADRIATIRRTYEKHGVVIDPHTADGVKVGLEHREATVPLVCLATAAPAKFSATIREALGREPERPAEFRDLERLPQRFTLVEPDAEAVKRYISSHA